VNLNRPTTLSLVLTFFAPLLLGSPARTDQGRVYEQGAHLIEIAPQTEFVQCDALLRNGELVCPSAKAYTIILWYASGMRVFDADETSIAERKTVEAALGCHSSEVDQIVDVRMIFNLVVCDHPLDQRTIAKITLVGGEEAYVRIGSLQF
jgi:hypothetical protein